MHPPPPQVESIRISAGGRFQPDRTTVALTASRLGHDVRLHAHVCRSLARSVLDCRSRDRQIIVANGSAIEPWARRAAELFDVPCAGMAVDENVDADIHVVTRAGHTIGRDEALIAMADRIDAFYVRKKGRIGRAIRRRLSALDDVSVRVAVSPRGDCDAAALIDSGAIGWYWQSEPISAATPMPGDVRSWPDWAHQDGQWLVHCTRGRDGPWPGETEAQYRDAMLLGYPDATRRGPVDALSRIIGSRRLVASAVATSPVHPVVCFSAVPLADLLARRCFRPHLGRWDYEPFGVAIRTEAAKQIGIRPVIYGEAADRKTLDPEDRFRFQPVGRTYDWQSEQEWRSPTSIDLDTLGRDNVRVFAATPPATQGPWPVSLLDGRPLGG